MRRTYLTALITVVMLMTAGCTTSTKYGKCIGLNGTPDPTLTYEYSGWNILVGGVFIETVFVPIITMLDGLKCPVGRTPVSK